VLVESVAWVSNLKRLLASAFVLAGAVAWERAGGKASRGGPALAFLFLALACHPIGVALVAILFATTWTRRRTLRTREAWIPASAAAEALAYGLGFAGAYGTSLEEATGAATIGAVRSGRLLRAADALLAHLRHLAWPVGLDPNYEWPYRGMERDAALGAFAAAALGAAAIRAARRGSAAFAGLALFWGSYLPAAGPLVPRYAPDSFLYLPALGLSAAAAPLARLLPARGTRPAFLAALAALSLLCVAQVGRWKDPVTLWTPNIERAPRMPRPYAILAETWAGRGEPERAAGVLDSGRDVLRRSDALTLAMAEVYRAAGRPADAIEVCLDVLSREPEREPEAPAFLIDTLATFGLPVTEDPGIRATIRAAAERVLRERPLSPEQRARLAAYFAERGAPEIAALFRRAPG
jgi:hypothetical protein